MIAAVGFADVHFGKNQPFGAVFFELQANVPVGLLAVLLAAFVQKEWKDQTKIELSK